MESRKIFFTFSFFILMTSVIHYFSLNLVDIGARDNANYKGFYDNIEIILHYSIRDTYQYYHNKTGASEPVFYIFSMLFGYLCLDYYYFVLVLNLFFIYALARFVCFFDFKLIVVFLLGIYLSCDYYIFSLFSEIQRLKLSSAFLLLCMSSTGSRRLFFGLLMVLCHFQMIILMPFVFNLWEYRKKFILPFFIIIAFMGEPIMMKFLWYFSGDIKRIITSLIYFSILVLFFSSYSLVVFRTVRIKYIAFLIYMLVPILLVGHERLNIFIIEGSVLYFMYELSNRKDLTLFRFLMIFLLVVFLCIYNLYKIYSQYIGLI